MERLKRSFSTFQLKYQERLPLFKKVIDQWKIKGTLDTYQQGMTLLERIEQSIWQLKSGNITDRKVYAKILSSGKSAYKELSELVKPPWRQWAEAIVVALAFAIVFRNFLFGLYHVPTGSAEYNILVGDRIWGNKMAYYFNKPQRGDLVIFDNPEFTYNASSSLSYFWQKYIGLPIPLLGLEGGPDNWVKRVVAVPGDIIEGRVENDRTVVYINGKKMDEPYVDPYPLIYAKKDCGFIDADHIGPFSIPSFLRYSQKLVRYTFDPSKTLSDQPFYSLTDDEIIKDFVTGAYKFEQPYSPTYTYDALGERCVDVFGPFTIPAGKYWMMGDSRKNSRDSRYWLYLDEHLIHGRASFIIYSIDSEEAFWIFDLLKHPLDFWTKHIRWARFFCGLGQYNGWQKGEVAVRSIS